MNIAGKINGICLVGILGILVVGYISYSGFKAVDEEFELVKEDFDSLKEDLMTELELLGSLSLSLLDMDHAFTDYLITKDPDLLERIDRNHRRFQDDLYKLERIPGGLGRDYSQDIRELYEDEIEDYNLIQEFINARPQLEEEEALLQNESLELHFARYEMDSVTAEMLATSQGYANMERRNAVYEIEINTLRSVEHLGTYLSTGKEVEKKEFWTDLEHIEKNLEIYLNHGGDPALYARANTTLQNIAVIGGGAITLFEDIEVSRAEYDEQLHRIHTDIDATYTISDGLRTFVYYDIDKITKDLEASTMKHEKAMDRTISTIFAITAAVLVATAILSFVLSRKITLPIVALKDIAVRVGKGDLDVKAEVASDDEIGQLAESFNQMTADLKDMTEEIKEYSRQLEHSNRLKELFTDIMRHDLLNPVSVILSSTGLMKINSPSGSLQDPEAKESIEMIERNAEKLREMINSASVLAKVEDLENLEFKEQDLTLLIREAAEGLRNFADEKDIKIDCNLDGASVAPVNPLIEDVFSNLISNAIKYSPEKSTVTIDVEDSDDMWKIMVKDQGEGIPDNAKEEIFERFKRKEKGAVKGSGLGLAIVKRVVELHNGKVWVEDNHEGGSIFNVALPKYMNNTPKRV